MRRLLRPLIARSLIGMAALLIGLVYIAGVQAGPAGAAAPPAAVAPAAASGSVSYSQTAQPTEWDCGPTATYVAISVLQTPPSIAAITTAENTDENGTDSVADVTPVLNANGGNGFYVSKYIGGETATAAQIALLKSDVVYDISHGHAIVANVVGTGTDTGGTGHTYSGGHYLTVVGYSSSGDTVNIWDVAGGHAYSMSVSNLATWIAERGYSA